MLEVTLFENMIGRGKGLVDISNLQFKLAARLDSELDCTEGAPGLRASRASINYWFSIKILYVFIFDSNAS